MKKIILSITLLMLCVMQGISATQANWNITSPSWGDWYTQGQTITINWTNKTVSKGYKIIISYPVVNSISNHQIIKNVDQTCNTFSFRVPCNVKTSLDGYGCSDAIMKIEVVHEGRLGTRGVEIKLVNSDPNYAPIPEKKYVIACGDGPVELCLKKRCNRAIYTRLPSSLCVVEKKDFIEEERYIKWYEILDEDLIKDPSKLNTESVDFGEPLNGASTKCLMFTPKNAISVVAMNGQRRQWGCDDYLTSPYDYITVLKIPKLNDLLSLTTNTVYINDAAQAAPCPGLECILPGTYFPLPTIQELELDIIKNLPVISGLELKSSKINWVYSPTNTEEYMTIYQDAFGKMRKKVCYHDLDPIGGTGIYKGIIELNFRINGVDFKCTQEIFVTVKQTSVLLNSVKEARDKYIALVNSGTSNPCAALLIVLDLMKTPNGTYICPDIKDHQMNAVTGNTSVGPLSIPYSIYFNSLYDFKWSPTIGLSNPNILDPMVQYDSLPAGDTMIQYEVQYKPRGSSEEEYSFFNAYKVFKAETCEPEPETPAISENADNTKEVVVKLKNDSISKMEKDETKSQLNIESKTEIIKNSIKIYPNPANDLITLEYEIHNDAALKIYNIAGKVFYETKLLSTENKYIINSNEFPNGVYYISIDDNKSIAVSKIIILR